MEPTAVLDVFFATSCRKNRREV